MHIKRIDLVVVDDRSKSRARQGVLCIRILSLQIVHMKCRRQCILMKIRQAEQCRETDAPHAAHKCTLLCLETIREDTLVSHQMQRLVFIRIVGLLKYGNVVRTALMQVAVLITVDRIDFQPYIAEIFLCQLTCLTDVFHIALCAALAGQHQDFLDTGIRDNFHLMLNFLEVQLLSMNVIVTVESTVNAVILTVVCNIKRRKQINRIAEMLARLHLRALCHPLKERPVTKVP